MAKNNLIGGSIWDEYSQKMQDRMNRPKFMGEFNEKNTKNKDAKLIAADFGAKSRGGAVRLFWPIDEKTGTIIDMRFKSFGCGTAVTSNDTMAEFCIDKKVDEAVKVTDLDVEFAMRDEPNTLAVSPQKVRYSVVAYDVIKQTAAAYKGVSPEDFEEQIIVYECARISLGTIKEVIRLNDLHSVEEIVQYTKAEAFYKSCIKPGGHEARRYYLVDVLTQARTEMDKERLENSMKDDVTFDETTVVGQLKAVEVVLDAEIHPMLQEDNDDMEVIDIQRAEEGAIDIYIRYLRACNGCSGGSRATLYAIESILQEELSPNICVIPV